MKYRWKRGVCGLSANAQVWERSHPIRQGTSVFFILWYVSFFLFFAFGAICYYLNFDKSLMKDPKFRRNQIQSEVLNSLSTLLLGSLLTAPIFVAQFHGFANIYKFGSLGLWYEIAQFPLFVLFNDVCLYVMHRIFHTRFLFRLSHKKHHSYVIPTPFSGYAFDPVEAWIMSLPIYSYSFVFPMSDYAQVVVLVFNMIWTMILHDNRVQFHTVHHKNINYNFGQYFAIWDILGGTYKDPVSFFALDKTK
ncbi:hypothetical protein GQ53DRAFT_650457 [Thozetella sp. PMI_491]|nr:hypothetical protein GQ53DRAFT_650457 [Thozetella sp. PMI_491]